MKDQASSQPRTRIPNDRGPRPAEAESLFYQPPGGIIDPLLIQIAPECSQTGGAPNEGLKGTAF